jgi:mRNA-degrading endonuclease RelE of RelBE toxin-antitoxin system
MLTLIESPAFTEQCTDLWTDAEYAAFQQFLVARPEAGDVIPGLGGLRKVRWSAKGRGKRGGARVIYLLLLQPGLIYLFQAYTKGDIADLAPDQKKRLRAAVDEIKKHHNK